ncbi:CoA-binding domain containing protein [Ceratobasidium theobromae]|uniref:CoA-binding domain containing protein n=1 Tax=Ceratobasidium theobromae TaxID=1582974 RepID=A0A5N5QI45_9AGAM|nr:CoA-binding domain containing protein [Ceratobasidium theobromae]
MSAQNLFFKSPNFAVVGASKDQSKYGTKVLKWYLERKLSVTPVHPKELELEGVATVKTVSELKSPAETSISIITNPKVTLGILKEGKERGVPAFWLQPGAEDDEVRAYVEEAGLKDKVVLGGPCILISGDGVRKSLL